VTRLFLAVLLLCGSARAAPGLLDVLTPAGRPPLTLPDAYRDAVLALNPSAYWILGEGAGVDAADQTGNYPATYVNGPTLGFAGIVPASPATCVDFTDGVTNQYVTAGTINLTSAYSVVVWQQCDSQSEYRPMVSCLRIPAPTYDGWVFDIDLATGAARWTSCNASACDVFTGKTDVVTGGTFMVAITGSGVSASIYVGGSVDNSTATAKVMPLGIVGTYTFLGAREDTGSTDYAWDGRLAHVAVWNGTTLAPAQIQGLATAAGL